MSFYSKTLLFLLFCVNFSHAQTYNIKRFSVEDGLAQSQVLAIHQDKFGNLWLGTNGGGISIYNGNDFKTLNKDNGLANNVVYSIGEDSKGNVLIGTFEGLSIYNGWIFKNYTEENGLPNNKVWKVFTKKNGEILIGTGKGAYKMTNNKFEKIIEDSLLGNSLIYNIFVDSKDRIFCSTLGNGFFIIENEKIINFNKTKGLPSNSVRSIIEDNENKIWISTDEGLCTYINNKLTLIETSSGHMSSIKSKYYDEVLFCNSGGYIYNNLSKLSENNSSSIHTRLNVSYKLYTMYEDYEGSVWLGSFDGSGLIKFPRRTFINLNMYTDSLLVNNIYSIYEYPNDNFLIGGYTKGISSINFKNNKLTLNKYYEYDYFNGITIFAINEDKKNKLWFSSSNSITKIDSITNKFTVFVSSKAKQKALTIDPKYKKEEMERAIRRRNNMVAIDSIEKLRDVYCIQADSKNNVWFGTKYGILMYSNDKFYDFSKQFPETAIEVFKIFEDKDRNLWFNTNSGVFYYNYKTLKRLGTKDGFTDDKVVSMVQDKRGNFWFGTKQGIYRFDDNFFLKIQKSTSDLINKEKGLSSNNIYSLILDDSDNLFIGTDKGIDKFNLRIFNSSREVDIKNYGQLEGFMGQECNLNACYKDHTGRLWFGTVGGVTVYDPKFDIKNMVKPITQITNIQLAYKDFDWTPYCDGLDSVSKLPINLVLPYDKNHFTFDFVAASLAIPEKVKYQYILIGLTGEWSPAKSKNEADFPSLPDGDYTFKVKACNNDGVWNEIPTEFKFTILPPFWKTWWFYTIILIIIILILFIYIKLREAKLIKDKAILEKTVEERTEEVVKQKEIVEQKNKDITDSINYAKNIQEAVLINIAEIQKTFEESFVLYKPRDIVSGDFYWYNQKGNNYYIAAADCTGHGVPGAFMSMLGMAFLNEIVNNNDDIFPAEILNLLRANVIVSLHQTGKEGESKDGMDIALCMFNQEKNELMFSGANNPLYMIRKKENYKAQDFENLSLSPTILETTTSILIEIKGDKMPIGYYIKDSLFENHNIKTISDDRIYLFSDGFADQFGGPHGKKFKYKKFKEILLGFDNTQMNEQGKTLDKEIREWRGDIEQIDDIIVVGIKI